jgi:hypothetical protein
VIPVIYASTPRIVDAEAHDHHVWLEFPGFRQLLESICLSAAHHGRAPDAEVFDHATVAEELLKLRRVGFRLRINFRTMGDAIAKAGKPNRSALEFLRAENGSDEEREREQEMTGHHRARGNGADCRGEPNSGQKQKGCAG